MPLYSIFDIAGPIMIGPSSSHTAGACKIGQFARALYHGTPSRVTFYLHGSFGKVYAGHATDRALLSGIMKFKTRDERMKNSFQIATEKGLKFKFIAKDLGEKYHPNTVKIVLSNRNRTMSVIGSSIGGGMIRIVKIDDFDVHLRGVAGKYRSFVVCHDKKKHVLQKIKKRLQKYGLEIREIVSSSWKNKMLNVINFKGRDLFLDEVRLLENIPGVDYVRSLYKLPKE